MPVPCRFCKTPIRKREVRPDGKVRCPGCGTRFRVRPKRPADPPASAPPPAAPEVPALRAEPEVSEAVPADVGEEVFEAELVAEPVLPPLDLEPEPLPLDDEPPRRSNQPGRSGHPPPPPEPREAHSRKGLRRPPDDGR